MTTPMVPSGRNLVARDLDACFRRLSCDTCQCRLALARACWLWRLRQFSVERLMRFLVLAPERPMRFLVLAPQRGGGRWSKVIAAAPPSAGRDGADAAPASVVERGRTAGVGGRATDALAGARVVELALLRHRVGRHEQREHDQRSEVTEVQMLAPARASPAACKTSPPRQADCEALLYGLNVVDQVEAAPLTSRERGLQHRRTASGDVSLDAISIRVSAGKASAALRSCAIS